MTIVYLSQRAKTPGSSIEWQKSALEGLATYNVVLSDEC
jgi:hypothetical protein